MGNFHAQGLEWLFRKAFTAAVPQLIGMLLCGVPLAGAETVEGRVIDAATGAGIGGATVDLQSWSAPRRNTVTDGSGSFRFDDLEAGEYRLRFESANYVTAEENTVIRVSTGRPLTLEARMVAWSKLLGRVVDPHGEPLPHARVKLSGAGFTMSGRAYQRTSWGDAGGVALTDAPLEMSVQGTAGAQGEFEVRVTPGVYQLVALPAEGAPRPTGESGALLAWQQSAPLRVGVSSGAFFSGLDLRVEAAPAFAVRGEVRNPDRTPAAGATVTLEDPFYGYKTWSRPDGTFEFSAVPRGTWCFGAYAETSARALECVAVGPQEVQGLQLNLSVPMPLRVLAVAEDSPGTPRAKEPRRAGQFAPSTSVGEASEPVGDSEVPPLSDAFLLTMAAGPHRPLPARNRHTLFLFGSGSGRYTAKDAYPGRYTFSGGIQPPGPSYLARLLAGGQDLLREEGEIMPAQVLTLLFRTDSGSVRGRVEHCASGTVLLVPRDATRRGRGWSRSGGCDAQGDYEIAGVPPGDYAAIALAGNSPIPLLDDALMQQVSSVTVRSGATATLDLQTTNAPIH